MPTQYILYFRKTLIVLIFIVVIGTPLFYLRQSVYPYTLPKTAFFQSVAEAIFFVWLGIAVLDTRYRPKRTPLLIAGGIFLFLLVLTAATGVDSWRSFWSTQERAFGVVALLHMGALALVASSLGSEIPWKRLWYASLSTSLVIVLAAFIQLKDRHFLLHETVAGDRPGSTFGNPTFLAGYLLFHVFVALYFLLKSRETPAPRSLPRNRGENVFLALVLLGNVTAIFITQTRGDILGLLAAGMTLLFLFAFRPPHITPGFFAGRKPYVLLLGAVFLGGTLFWTTRIHPLWSGIPGLSRFQDISIENQNLLPRLIALRAGWSGFLEKPLSGWGWDNFNVVFNKYYDPRALEVSYQETRFDKPHNALLEYFVAGGAPLGIAYLALLGVFILQASRLTDRLFGSIAIGVVTGYFVRSLFVFETIGPLLMASLLVGYIDGAYRASEENGAGKDERKPESQFQESPRMKTKIAVAIAFASLIPIYAVNILSIEASYYQFWGFTNFARSKPALAIKSFKEGVRLKSSYRSNFKRDYATAVAEAYFYNPGVVTDEAAWDAVRAMEEVVLEHPIDAYNRYAIVDLYNQVSSLDPEKLLTAAEREAEIALGLTPNRQEVYFSLAKTKSLRGDYGAALEILRKTLDLNPKVPDAHFYYGLIAFASGKPDLGYTEIKKAIRLGRGWRNFYEPRVVGNYFADAGYLNEAIELYKTSLGMGPDDLETKVKLGVAYFLVGKNDLARKYLREVMSKVDLSESPQYNNFKPIFEALGLDI